MGKRGPAELYVGDTAIVERRNVDVHIDTDPTGASPSFGFRDVTTATATDDTVPTTFTTGAWHSDGYANETVTAQTPTLGASASGAGVEFNAADALYRVWIKFTVGTETFVRPCGYLQTKA